jgi:16S rRNA (adenine1518-N6/adenine1519-N6)-dimethyltransferase
LAREELIEHANVVMLNQDALRNKSHLDERVIEAVGAQLATGSARRLKLVANLPYNIATPVIANLLALPSAPHSMTVTVQKELADRMLAQPGTKDYGALAVWIQSQARVELVRTLPPSVFWPRPLVTSAIIHVAVAADLRSQIADLGFFHDFVRGLFLHRRKYLRGSLAAAWKERLDKPAIDRILADARIDSERRADELDVATILQLSDMFRQSALAAGKD